MSNERTPTMSNERTPTMGDARGFIEQLRAELQAVNPQVSGVSSIMGRFTAGEFRLTVTLHGESGEDDDMVFIPLTFDEADANLTAAEIASQLAAGGLADRSVEKIRAAWAARAAHAAAREERADE